MKTETQQDREDLALALATLSQASMCRPITGPRLLRFARKLFQEYAEQAHPFDTDLLREEINEVNIERLADV